MGAYEKKADVSAFLKTKSYEDDLMNLVPAAMHEWAEDGYSVYPLCNAQGCGIPQSLYNQWYDIASSEANQHYSFEENSFIIARNEELASPIGPLMTTKWHQFEPYSLSVPYFYSDNFTYINLGQAPVIVGEIMKYHQYPSTISWSDFPDQLPDGYPYTTPLSNFLYNLGDAMHSHYESGSPDFDSDSVFDFLESQGYLIGNLGTNPSFSAVSNEISQHNPLFAFGKDQLDNPHIWSVDGVKTISVYRRYSLKIISVTDYPSLYFWSPCQDYSEYESSYHMYHLHLGKGGLEDGWYFQTRNFTPPTVPNENQRIKFAKIHLGN